MIESILEAGIEKIDSEYPGLDILQLGFVVLHLAHLRHILGHENARSTLRDYVHTEGMSGGVKLCVEFIEREIFALTKSKLDVDFYKMGNQSSFRSNSKYRQSR